MARYFVIAVDKPDFDPYEISRALQGQLHYFTEGTGSRGGKESGNSDEFFFPLHLTSELFEEGVFYVISPLDDQNQAEIEITEEQEDFLDWLVSNKIERVRISETI